MHSLLVMRNVQCTVVFSYCFALFVFFFNDTATTEIYTLSLHDALPIYAVLEQVVDPAQLPPHADGPGHGRGAHAEHRSEEHRLNSSHPSISYAVFCLKKKKKNQLCCHDTSRSNHHGFTL